MPHPREYRTGQRGSGEPYSAPPARPRIAEAQGDCGPGQRHQYGQFQPGDRVEVHLTSVWVFWDAATGVTSRAGEENGSGGVSPLLSLPLSPPASASVAPRSSRSSQRNSFTNGATT